MKHNDDCHIGALIELRERRLFIDSVSNLPRFLYCGAKVVILGFLEFTAEILVLTTEGNVGVIEMYPFTDDRGVEAWEQEISNRLDK